MIASVLLSLNQVFEAGIAITALSLFIRHLTFNLRDRVSRSFAVVLACIMVVFSGEAISSSVQSTFGTTFWLRFQWIGIVIFPSAFVHFSDALLETTGQPSRGRRSKLVRILYLASCVFLITLPYGILVGPVEFQQGPVPHLRGTPLSAIFTAYYLLSIIFAGWTIWRAYRRTRLRHSRRRMWYLMSGALFLVLGTYPYLQIGSSFAYAFPDVFMGFATLGNLFVFIFLVVMAYAVAFFGVPWPDRLIKSRLLKWLLRGPFTVFITLILLALARKTSLFIGVSSSVINPIITVTTILLIEHIVTLVFPFLERWVFQGGDRENLQLLQEISDRLITTSDLREFLEAVLASVCDKFQVSTGFIADFNETGIEQVVQFGNTDMLEKIGLNEAFLQHTSNGRKNIFEWGDFWLMPLYSAQDDELLGLLGVMRDDQHDLSTGLSEALLILGQRATTALQNRRIQQQLFQSLQILNPKVDLVQRLRASTRYDQRDLFLDADQRTAPKDVSRWVKDALTHYWGGPKLTESPLMKLNIVQEAAMQSDGNLANALRAILKSGIESIKPEGERHFTGEWILYNILELKFMQGRKVREVALRLAMSEADLYRKQRIAIEEVAKAIIDMERQAVIESSGEEK